MKLDNSAIKRNQLDTPVLFLIFNRPNPTHKVFQEIKKIRPAKLYVSADGPRENYPDDRYNCEQARKIIEKIDWNCKVSTLFRDDNLGCGASISQALDWFFDNENEGIILEDDCVPNQSFFMFCKNLLEKYKNDSRIMHINGNNFNAPLEKMLTNFERSSYYFCSFPQVWGWATWKRAWEKFDFKIPDWPQVKKEELLVERFPSYMRYYEKSKHFDNVFSGKVDTWDFQWQYAVLSNNGLVISPQSNLISNIGYGRDSTHIKEFDAHRNNLSTCEIEFPLKRPLCMLPNKLLDLHYASQMGMRIKFKNLPIAMKNWFKYYLKFRKKF
jgi:hypothetical protein